MPAPSLPLKIKKMKDNKNKQKRTWKDFILSAIIFGALSAVFAWGIGFFVVIIDNPLMGSFPYFMAFLFTFGSLIIAYPTYRKFGLPFTNYKPSEEEE